MRRYATVWIKPLNAGSGECVRNFETALGFELFWKSWGTPFRLPTPGCYGSIGNGIFGLTYKIYRDEKPAVRTLESRLLEFKNKRHMERGEPIQMHAFDSWK